MWDISYGLNIKTNGSNRLHGTNGSRIDRYWAAYSQPVIT